MGVYFSRLLITERFVLPSHRPPPHIAQILGASPSNPHNTSRQATRTALSSFIAGSTCGANTRTTTMRSLGLVAPAVALTWVCLSITARAASSAASRRVRSRGVPTAKNILAMQRWPARPNGLLSSRSSAASITPRSSHRPGTSRCWVKRPCSNGWPACAIGQGEVAALQGQRAGGAVEARGAGGGDQTVGAGADGGGDVQRVAAHQAAGWVHQHVVADGVALGVQALQDAQRPVVLIAGYGAGVVVLCRVVELQAGVPGHGVVFTIK